MFSLEFDILFSTIDFESLESKENETLTEINNTSNTTSTANERPALTETTLETNNLPAPDQSRFLGTVQETLKEAENKNTKRSTTTCMRVWSSWAKSRNININMETISPAALDEILQKYYLEVRKQDGSEYEPDSLQVMQAALERYLSDKKYPYSLISGREFSTSRAVLDAKAKQLRMNGYGKRQNRAQPYNPPEEELVCSSGSLGDHSGAALTNVNFGFRSRQDHYHAYVQDFEVVSIQIKEGEMAKRVCFSESPTKTRTSGLTVKHRKTPQEMLATDGSSRDPVRLFEEFLGRCPSEMRTSGPLYLAKIQRPKPTFGTRSPGWANTCKLGSNMRILAKTLNVDGKRISNHSTRKIETEDCRTAKAQDH